MSYTEEEIKQIEAERWNRVAAALTPVADEISQLWAHGDGRGGSLLDYIAEHLTELGYQDCYTDRTAPEFPHERREHIPGSVRKEVFERDLYRCQACGEHRDLVLDHIYPYSLGGPSTADNLQVLCRGCNSKKGATVE